MHFLLKQVKINNRSEKAAEYLLCLKNILVLNGEKIKERQNYLFELLFSDDFKELISSEITQFSEHQDQLSLEMNDDGQQMYTASLFGLLATLCFEIDEPKRKIIKSSFPISFFTGFFQKKRVYWQVKTAVISFFHRLYLNNLEFSL